MIINKTWKVDYIIIDEPKRLSRNNIDTSRIIDLMDKKLIKWIISNTRQYYSEHSRDKFFLQFDLSLSKMDNEDRASRYLSQLVEAWYLQEKQIWKTKYFINIELFELLYLNTKKSRIFFIWLYFWFSSRFKNVTW